ncbi:MAG: hypothetical protein IH851_11765 [Armatimonadetes bacterium]|nr:hypothetical protein [Armatimonadota bacterium]
MKILLITNDAALAKEARRAYMKTDNLQVFKDWQKALGRAKKAHLMIVDIVATLTAPNRIKGYEEFAEAKMAHKDAKDVPLVLISAPDGYKLDAMVGWPGFVFGHVRRPITWKIFRRISTWV